MATKKSTTTTKAKTKTTKTKKPAAQKATSAKAASSTKAAATTKAKAPAAKKAAAPKPLAIAEVKQPGRIPNLQSLRKLSLLSAAVFVLLAIVAGLLMGNASYQMTVGHLTKDTLASQSTTVFAPAVQSLVDVQIRWVLVAIMLLSAVMPILYVTKLEGRYAQYLRTTRMQPYRWVDLAVTTALMMETIALLSGVHDGFVLKLVGGLMATTAVLGLVTERQNNAVDKPVRSAYYTSLFTGVLPWVLVVAYAIATVVFGAVRSPWYVYALYAVAATGFIQFAVNLWYSINKKGKWKDYMVVESTYLTINLLTKVAFAAVLIIGLQK